ncbi:thioesterase II family protein [Polyangium aurulentum]|uniref:thioesterase II family protein n=1 Tax=Polyangium aurulentum TaxID=2567896 RepID=UPI00146A49A3|nr:alpha/beta fold hydrolase [Polyangium aurulentum]UQA61132.1 putative thioesterase [Polyangium aurulentum]
MSSRQSTLPALVTVPAQAGVRLRLFVFPHAGGGAFPYRFLGASLPPWIELAIVQLPGRETLFLDPPFRAMGPLLEALETVLGPHLDAPFAFLGHSFGSHVAFQLACTLRRKGAPTPRGLIVSGSRAPQIPRWRPQLHAMSNEQLIDELRRYGGTPQAVLESREMMDLFLPPLRADLSIFETYEYTPEEPLSVPITALGGRSDHTVKPDEIEAWGELTRGPFEALFFGGGHFYLFESSRPLFEAAVADAASALV